MYYYKHQYSNDLWPLKIKRNCILLINRSKLLIKLIIKNAVGLILDNFGIVGFLFFSPIPVDSSHFSLHFDNILSPKAPIYFILNVLKRSLILAYGPTGGVSVLNITLPVVQRWVSTNPRLKFNPLFWFMYLCTSVYFKTSKK